MSQPGVFYFANQVQNGTGAALELLLKSFDGFEDFQIVYLLDVKDEVVIGQVTKFVNSTD